MKIIQCDQGTTEWFAARCGLVTASEVDALVTPKFAIRKGAGVDSYVCKKVAEKLLGWSADMLAPVGKLYNKLASELSTIVTVEV